MAELFDLSHIDVTEFARLAKVDPTDGAAIFALRQLVCICPQILKARQFTSSAKLTGQIKKLDASIRRFLMSTLHIDDMALYEIARHNASEEYEETVLARYLRTKYHDTRDVLKNFQELTSPYVPTLSPLGSSRRQQVVECCADFFEKHTPSRVSAATRSRFFRFAEAIFVSCGERQDITRTIRNVVKQRRDIVTSKNV